MLTTHLQLLDSKYLTCSGCVCVLQLAEERVGRSSKQAVPALFAHDVVAGVVSLSRLVAAILSQALAGLFQRDLILWPQMISMITTITIHAIDSAKKLSTPHNTSLPSLKARFRLTGLLTRLQPLSTRCLICLTRSLATFMSLTQLKR